MMAMVYKFSQSQDFAQILLDAVEEWQKAHKPGVAHPEGACSTAVAKALLLEITRTRAPSTVDRDTYHGLRNLAEHLLSNPGSNERIANEVVHCSARLNLKKTHLILDLRFSAHSELMQYSHTVSRQLERKEGETTRQTSSRWSCHKRLEVADSSKNRAQPSANSGNSRLSRVAH